jgi:hypothetical protein
MPQHAMQLKESGPPPGSLTDANRDVINGKRYDTLSTMLELHVAPPTDVSMWLQV